ncbi:hypothetical protein EV44_g0304 [Erysiphe necator]|uniref:Uncharacterized protein n=1 Tax=Uncinula necator TaxID=52586 RepID=A0A0B1P5P3_UNCNE|nr:hypothetical protein EV44_g0304 [Erysiphe necator]
MQLQLVLIVITIVFVSITSSTDFWNEQTVFTEPVYYDCGSWIFYEENILEMLSSLGGNIDQLGHPFIEPLYNLRPDYRKISIPQELCKGNHLPGLRQECHFSVIIDQMAQIVDIVSQMNNGFFIKCKRVDQLVPQPQPYNLNECNFECGQEIITQNVIHLSLTRALSNIGPSDLRGTQYHGNLYAPELNYWIYPITQKNQKKSAAIVPEYTYYIVLTPSGEIKDVIAKLMHKDFMKCASTTKDPPDNSLDRNLEFGYMCGTKFLGSKFVKRTALHAKKYRKSSIRWNDFPKPYDGPGSRSGLSIFPILTNGKFYIGSVGRVYKYFIVINSNFEIEFAVMKTPEGYKLCD